MRCSWLRECHSIIHCLWYCFSEQLVLAVVNGPSDALALALMWYVSMQHGYYLI